jgi:hypothetical protein
LDIDYYLHCAPDQSWSVADPEIKAVKLAAGAVIEDFFSVRRTALVQLVNVKDDLLTLPFDSQRSSKPERISIFSCLDLCALKADVRVTVGVQEVYRPQVHVAALYSGIKARGLDCDFDRRATDILLVKHDVPGKLSEAPSHSEEKEMFEDKLNRAVRPIDSPNGLCVASDFCCLHLSTLFNYRDRDKRARIGRLYPKEHRRLQARQGERVR